MTISEIADFSEFRDCTVELADPSAGLIQIDGTGVRKRYNNYRRFLQFNELSRLPSPKDVLERATIFRILRGDEERALTREEFEAELAEFRHKVGT